MLLTATGTITTSTSHIVLPTDFKQAKLLQFTPNGTTGKHVPELRNIDSVWERIGYGTSTLRATGLPQYWGLDGTSIQFELRANVNYPYRLDYYRSLPALTSATGGVGTTTNFLTSEYPRLLRSICNALSYEWLKNEKEKLYWLSVAEKEVFEANTDTDELEGADLRMEIG